MDKPRVGWMVWSDEEVSWTYYEDYPHHFKYLNEYEIKRIVWFEVEE